MKNDESKSKAELLYEMRLLRLENLKLTEQLAVDCEVFDDRRQVRYLENIALIDKAIRQNTVMEDMMNSLMKIIRSIFQCEQTWLLYPCDPNALSWQVPYRSFSTEFPIPFGPEDKLPATGDLVENCKLALGTEEPIPLGISSSVKEVPEEARDAAAKSALLISLHPKVGRPWLMGLHQCSEERVWSPEEKRMFQDISGRICDALSTTLFYRDLENNQKRLKHLSTQLVQSQEDERKRLAEEIHDELSQAALAMKVGVENAIYLLDNPSEPVRRSLQGAANLSKSIVDKMRQMQTSLYPPTLRDFGVITALNGFLDDYANIYQVEIRRGIHVTESVIPHQIRVPVFRIAQEALYNAGKHSHANSVTVVLDSLHDQFFLEIVDDGCGFDPNTLLENHESKLGLGINSMRERADMSGGKLRIESHPGCGTSVQCAWKVVES